jgi:hypothetical protein
MGHAKLIDGDVVKSLFPAGYIPKSGYTRFDQKQFGTVGDAIGV